MARDQATGAGEQYLTFILAGEEYALGILKVREVLEYDTITRVPGVPPSICGVINLRGSVLPVIDLAVKFGLPKAEITKRTCIVIVEVAGVDGVTLMGVMAEAVNQVITLQVEEIEPTPDFGTPVRVEFLRGMGRLGKKFALLLDTNRLLTAEELLSVTPLLSGLPPEGPSASSANAPPEGLTRDVVRSLVGGEAP